MKKLDREMFADRVATVNRAKRIFGYLTEGNISQAFEAYQLVLAEEEREIMITTKAGGGRRQLRFDKYERPKCPECGKDMLLQEVNTGPPTRVDDPNAKSFWACEDAYNCGYAEDYNNLTANEWANKLTLKGN